MGSCLSNRCGTSCVVIACDDSDFHFTSHMCFDFILALMNSKSSRKIVQLGCQYENDTNYFNMLRVDSTTH
ncbi:CLUMA_CG003188, isoform A [Clunio marinus]|uniref:CLUMA_CG003188, isoform A n=1 Tax=Clunio marinus TaxID=568069 RepID=A0A1J1HPI4_9DIPT|nr:CLUMA_CG003188, isoform A [Clunio marinus]